MTSVLIGNVMYDSLLWYLVLLTTFIPAWVFLVLGWQMYGKYRLRVADKENNIIEWG